MRGTVSSSFGTTSGWVCRGLAVITVVCAAIVPGGTPPASAAELYRNGDAELRWDNSITYSTAFRLNGRDATLLANRNGDDGDRNFAPGLISNRFDLLSQLDFSKGSFGLHASAALWYDRIYHQKNDNDSPDTFNPLSVSHNEFTHDVRDLHGARAELVNAFFYDNTELAGLPVSFRIGRYTLLWGESLFLSDNGIAAGQAPVDDTKVLGGSTPYAKDVYMPVSQVSASVQLPTGLAIEAYYQLEWRKTRSPGAGSYLSDDDYFDAGGERFLLRSGQALFRDRDRPPPDSGQYGAALRWSIDQVDYGFYALRFNAKDPKVYYESGIIAGSGNPPTIIDPSIVDLSIGKAGIYTLVYPQGIELYGASASGYIGASNIAAEVSLRRNMPLANVRIFLLPGQDPDANKNPLYPVGDTFHAQISSITTLARSPLWDAATISAEVAATDRIAVRKNPANLDPSTTKLAVTFRGAFEPTYFEVLPNLDLTLSLGLGYMAGRSSIESYQNKGPGSLDFGVTATYRVVWSGNVAFTHFLGNPNRQPFADRDFIRVSVQRSF
jgi:hypothetical protein